MCGEVLAGVEGRIVKYPLKITHIPKDQNTCHTLTSDGAHGTTRRHKTAGNTRGDAEKTLTPSAGGHISYLKSF